ncbi:MAG: protease pro-enzyme activation domain-containing protein, partial [bacterium]
MPAMHLRIGLSLAVALALVSAIGYAQNTANLPRIVTAVDDNQRVTLKGGTHPLARAEFDRGAAPAELPLNRMLLLLQHTPEQEGAAMHLLAEQQDPSSPRFHEWLTPDEFGEQFGPSTADIQIVTSWLETHGFQIASVARGRHTIEFSGTAGQVADTFQAPIHRFSVNGEEFWANANDPQVPAVLAPVISGFVSLNNYPLPPRNRALGVLRRSGETGEVSSAGANITFPSGGCFGGKQCFALGPYDFATIYNILPL